MATPIWIGGAEAVAQVTEWIFAGTWEADDVINVTIGTRTESVEAGDTVIATIVNTLFAALNASTQAEFAEITWSRSGNNLVGTADTAGTPFIATVATTETGGGAADAQTIDGAASSTGVDSTACTGPNHADNAQNWSGAALPVDSDTIVFADSTVDCLYGLTGINDVVAAVFEVHQTYTGKIGLPPTNAAGAYYEYRTRFLTLEAATILRVGVGEGTGSNRVLIDTLAGASAVLVLGTGSPEANAQAAFFWKGTHASNTLTVQKGHVGVGLYAGEVATVATLNVGYQTNPAGDAKVYLGTGVTLTTINQSGGILHTRSNVTTMNQTDGEWKHFAGTVTTVNIDGGSCRYRSTGTLTTLNMGSDGEMDFRQDASARTITNINMYEGFRWYDPAGTVTATNGFDFVRTSPGDSRNKFVTAENRTWTPTSI